MDRCAECQFEYDSETEESIPDRLRSLGRRYHAPLSRFLPGETALHLLRSHPVADTWSALEYACHMRDVLEVQRQRLRRTLVEDMPVHEPMGREERVLDLDYNGQEPAQVAADIAAHADALASAFAGLTPPQWTRSGVYAYPSRSERTLLWLGRHTIHEGHHHLLDLGRVMRAARGR